MARAGAILTHPASPTPSWRRSSPRGRRCQLRRGRRCWPRLERRGPHDEARLTPDNAGQRHDARRDAWSIVGAESDCLLVRLWEAMTGHLRRGPKCPASSERRRETSGHVMYRCVCNCTDGERREVTVCGTEPTSDQPGHSLPFLSQAGWGGDQKAIVREVNHATSR